MSRAADEDPLPGLRAELEGIDELGVQASADLLERVDATLAAELAALDEV